jgi:hypothetical protein
MGTRDFSGREIVKVLRSFGYRAVGRTGEHDTTGLGSELNLIRTVS